MSSPVSSPVSSPGIGPGPGPDAESSIVVKHIPRRIKPDHTPRTTTVLSSEDSDSDTFAHFVQKLQKGKGKATVDEGEDGMEENDDSNYPEHLENQDYDEGGPVTYYPDEDEYQEEEEETYEDVQGDEREGREDDDDEETHQYPMKAEKVRYKPRKARMVNKYPCETCEKRNRTCHMQDSNKARGACYECGTMKIKCVFTVSFLLFLTFFFFDKRLIIYLIDSIIQDRPSPIPFETRYCKARAIHVRETSQGLESPAWNVYQTREGDPYCG